MLRLNEGSAIESINPQRQLKIGVVLSQFNAAIGAQLWSGAHEILMKSGLVSVELVPVPGALEIPLMLQVLAQSKKFDGLIALGAVIRGDTFHFEIVSLESAAGIRQVQLMHTIPVANGILTTNTFEQAEIRALSKGRDCAQAVLDLIYQIGLFTS